VDGHCVTVAQVHTGHSPLPVESKTLPPVPSNGDEENGRAPGFPVSCFGPGLEGDMARPLESVSWFMMPVVSWSGFGWWPAPRPGMREREQTVTYTVSTGPRYLCLLVLYLIYCTADTPAIYRQHANFSRETHWQGWYTEPRWCHSKGHNWWQNDGHFVMLPYQCTNASVDLCLYSCHLSAYRLWYGVCYDRFCVSSMFSGNRSPSLIKKISWHQNPAVFRTCLPTSWISKYNKSVQKWSFTI